MKLRDDWRELTKVFIIVGFPLELILQSFAQLIMSESLLCVRRRIGEYSQHPEAGKRF